MKRFKGRSAIARAGMLAVGVATAACMAARSPAYADDVTPERLLNADKEAGNCLRNAISAR